MLDGLALPFICATNACLCAQFVNLKEILNHPLLQEDEKFLWCWFATSSANNHQSSCSFTYEQLSIALNKPAKFIHRILFRLKIMGLLQGNIPIWYGVPSVEMIHQLRIIKLVMPSKIPIDKERLNGVALPLTKRRAPKTFNLLPKRKPKPNKCLVLTKVALKVVINFVLDYPNFRRKLWNASFGLGKSMRRR